MTADVFLTNLTWRGQGHAHLHTPGCPPLQVSPPLAFGGEPNNWTPEELLTGAVEACVLMTFLYFVKRQRIRLIRYGSHAEARLEKTPEGLRFTGINLTLEIGIASPAEAEKVLRTIELAEKYCPVSHALNVPVHLRQTVSVVEGEPPPSHVNPYEELTTF